MHKKPAKVVIALEKSKLFMYSYHGGGETGAVSAKVDVTPVYHFLKEMFNHEPCDEPGHCDNEPHPIKHDPTP